MRSPALDVQSGRDQRSGGRGHLSGRADRSQQPIRRHAVDRFARRHEPAQRDQEASSTHTARPTKLRSMPCISADDAEYEEQKFASEISRVLRRKMGSGEMEVLASLVIRDFIVRGTAAGMVARSGGDTEFVRVPIYEIVFDHRECLHALRRASVARVRPEESRRALLRYPKARRRDRPASSSPTRDRTRGSR